MRWWPFRPRHVPPTLLSCPNHGDLYLVVPGVRSGDVLNADAMTPLKANLAQPRPSERFGYCPYGDGEPVRFGPVPRNVGPYA